MPTKILFFFISFLSVVAFGQPIQKDSSLAIMSNETYYDFGNRIVVVDNDLKEQRNPVVRVYLHDGTLAYQAEIDLKTEGELVITASMAETGMLLVNTLHYSPAGDDARMAICFDPQGKAMWKHAYLYPGGEMVISPHGKYAVVMAGEKFPVFDAADGSQIEVDYQFPAGLAVFDADDNLLVVGKGTATRFDVMQKKVLQKTSLKGDNGENLVVGPLLAENAIAVSPTRGKIACILRNRNSADGNQANFELVVLSTRTLGQIFKRAIEGEALSVALASDDDLFLSTMPRDQKGRAQRFDHTVFSLARNREIGKMPSNVQVLSNFVDQKNSIGFILGGDSKRKVMQFEKSTSRFSQPTEKGIPAKAVMGSGISRIKID